MHKQVEEDMNTEFSKLISRLETDQLITAYMVNGGKVEGIIKESDIYNTVLTLELRRGTIVQVPHEWICGIEQEIYL